MYTIQTFTVARSRPKNQTKHAEGRSRQWIQVPPKGIAWTRSLSTTPHRFPFSPIALFSFPHANPKSATTHFESLPTPTDRTRRRQPSLDSSSPLMALSQPSPSASTFPVREDGWTLDDTSTLIEAWGERHLDLNRGILRHKHWKEVADAINSSHERKSIRTAVQCKNRIDTLKRKYKIEKARIRESGGTYVCTWPFFSCLDDLIGNGHKSSTPVAVSNCIASPVTTPGLSLFSKVPVGPRSGTKKRRSTHVYRSFCNSHLRRDVNSKEDEGKDGLDSENSLSSPRFKDRDAGYRKLADAIGTITDIYERVEIAKQRHMVELEMQRMQFVKDLEYQRMQLLMEMHLQMQKIKRARRASGADCYS